MPTKDSVVKAIRIRRHEWEEIEEKLNGMTLTEYVRSKMLEPIDHIEGVSDEALEDLKLMMEIYGGTLADVLNALEKGMDEGYIEYREGKLVFV